MRVKEVLVAGALLAGACGGSSTEAEPADQKDQGIETGGLGRLDRDQEWVLESITAVGESELFRRGDSDSEATLLRFNLRLGETAVSCLVATDSDRDFPDAGYLNPEFCFIDGDVTQPLR